MAAPYSSYHQRLQKKKERKEKEKEKQDLIIASALSRIYGRLSKFSEQKH